MKLLIRKFLQKFGYDIIKRHPEFRVGSLNGDIVKKEFEWLRRMGFKTIIDIGANEGQFSEKMRILFPDAKIIAFEPIPSVFGKLKMNFVNDLHFSAYNTGLGDAPGSIEFYANEYSPSSSFLQMGSNHHENFDHAVATEKITLSVDTLDAVMAGQELSLPLLIKMDVQGFEDKVIAGGSAILQKASAIISEVSFETLYEKQPLFDTIYKLLQRVGFRYAGNIEQLHSPIDNKILQADAFFLK